MSELKKYSLVKPNLSTPFHIDFDWWMQYDNNWRVHLQSCLCSEHQAAFSDNNDTTWIDWIDPVTAEVHSIDGLQHVLITHCAKQTDFLTNYTTLVDSTFRSFLANGNNPLTSLELSEKIGKPAITILRTLSGPTVYKGIRPCHE